MNSSMPYANARTASGAIPIAFKMDALVRIHSPNEPLVSQVGARRKEMSYIAKLTPCTSELSMSW